MAIGHCSESARVDGVREKVGELGKMVVGAEGVGRLQEFEFCGVGDEDFAESPELTGIETFDLEGFPCRQYAIVVLSGVEHPNAKLVDVIVRREGVAVGIYKSGGRFWGNGMG